MVVRMVLIGQQRHHLLALRTTILHLRSQVVPVDEHALLLHEIASRDYVVLGTLVELPRLVSLRLHHRPHFHHCFYPRVVGEHIQGRECKTVGNFLLGLALVFDLEADYPIPGQIRVHVPACDDAQIGLETQQLGYLVLHLLDLNLILLLS